jgi:hypothetical protein
MQPPSATLCRMTSLSDASRTGPSRPSLYLLPAIAASYMAWPPRRRQPHPPAAAPTQIRHPCHRCPRACPPARQPWCRRSPGPSSSCPPWCPLCDCSTQCHTLHKWPLTPPRTLPPTAASHAVLCDWIGAAADVSSDRPPHFTASPSARSCPPPCLAPSCTSGSVPPHTHIPVGRLASPPLPPLGLVLHLLLWPSRVSSS